MPNEIDQYINQFPAELQEILQKIRATIQKTVPKATEKMSYGMPAFFQEGALVYYAMCKNHVGFYPTPSALNKFEDEISAYKHSKGAVQFPVDKPIPYDLIVKMTEFRLNENLVKSQLKKTKNGKC